MNLPLELQRRLDRRWSARFGMSERGSRPGPYVAMIGAKSRNLEIATGVRRAASADHHRPDESRRKA